MTYCSRKSWISLGFGSSSNLRSEDSESSSSMISLQRSMHSSQMYTPGPAMSFLTCFWLFPQNEHLSRSAPSPVRTTGLHHPLVSFPAARRYRPHPSIPHHDALPCPARRAGGAPAPRRRAVTRPPPSTPITAPAVSGLRQHRGLAGLQHLVHQAVLLGLLGREHLVAL